MQPQVIAVKTDRYAAQVIFDDGRSIILTPYRNSASGPIEGIQDLLVFEESQKIFSYSASKRRIELQTDGISQQEVAAYWHSAATYLQREYFDKPEEEQDDRLWLAWNLFCTEGYSHLKSLEEGTARTKE